MNSASPAPHLVTIGITCFNAADSIQRAIRAAGNQTWPNIEVLVVDDCSTDNSAALAAEALAALPNGRLVKHTQNTGVAGARATLLREAKGDFLAFADDDDESLPSRIETQLQRILVYEKQSGSTLIACYASGHRIYPNGHTLTIRAGGINPIVPHGKGMADRLLFFRTIPGWDYGGTPACSLMARVSTLQAAGGFDPAFRRVEDIDLAIRLALLGGHFIGAAGDLYRQHATTSNDKTHDKNLAAELQLVEKHKGYLQSIGYYTYARLWPQLRYAYFTKKYALLLTTFARLVLRYPLPVLRHILQTGPARLRRDMSINKKVAT